MRFTAKTKQSKIGGGTPAPAPTYYTLTVSKSPSAGGDVTGDGINTAIGDNTQSYPDGTVVSIGATPASGYTFSNWTGASTSTNATITVTMNANKSLTAVYSLVPVPPGFAWMAQSTYEPWHSTGLFRKTVTELGSTVHPNSQTILDYLYTNAGGNKVGFAEHSGVGGTTADWSTPFYVCTTSHPLVTINVNGIGDSRLNGVQIRCPSWALPEGGSDGYIVLIQPDGWFYAFTKFNITGSTLNCNYARRAKNTSSGLTEHYTNGDLQWGGVGQGGIGNWRFRTAEIIGNTINHAVTCTVPWWHGRVYPAAQFGNTIAQVASTSAPAFGQHFRLNPSLSISSFPTWKQRILKALQTYGCYINDSGGSKNMLTFHLESETPYVASGQSPTNLQYMDDYFGHTRGAYWDLQSGVDWQHQLQVLTVPPVQPTTV